MPDPTGADIVAAVRALEEDADMQAIHTRMRESLYPLHAMEHEEMLPEHFTRGDTMPIRLPVLASLAEGILADTFNFPTAVSVNLTGPPFNKDDQEEAEKQERWCALFRARVDEGRRVTQDGKWHLLLSPFTVLLLRCGSADKPFRWTVETPDPLTCSFPHQSAPFRPKRFGRHYKTLVATIQDTYGNERGFSDGKRPYMKADGGWDWTELTDDYPADAAMHTMPAKLAEEVEVYEYDTGEYISVACKGLGDYKDKDELVSRVKNLTGGVRAIVLSTGNPRRDKARYQPALWPVYQLILILNHLLKMRAIRSLESRPDVFFNQSPEQITALGQVDPTQWAKVVDMWQEFQSESGPQFMNVQGDPVAWNREDDPDLDKLITFIDAKLNQVVAGYSASTNEMVLQESNTNVWLSYLANIRGKLSPVLGQLDWGWAQMITMALHSIKEYNEEVPLYATGGEHYGKFQPLERGTQASLKPDDIDLDRFKVSVVTESISEQERRLLVQDAVYRESIGVSTHDEVLSAAGYADVALQNEALAKDAGIRLGLAWNDQQLAGYIQELMRLTAGVLIPSYGLPPPVAPGASSNGAKPPYTMSSPAIQGAGGGSEAPVG